MDAVSTRAGNSRQGTVDTASQVINRIAARFPGLALESVVQGWAFLEEFSEGVKAYEKISEPTSQDDRWVGVCYYQLVQDRTALEFLTKASNRGEVGARINIAHLLPFLERGDEAAAELARVDFDRLSDYDKALFFRVQSILAENSGNLREALSAAEEAWKRIQRIPEGGVLAPSVLAQLAVLHGRIGRSQRALWFVERGLDTTSGNELLKLRLRRAAVLVVLGRYQEAGNELASIDLETAPENIQVERLWLLGEIATAAGNSRQAIQRYRAGVEMASRLQFKYEELLCRLALVCQLGVKGDLDGASEQLTRAQGLISDKADRLVFRFREVLLLRWKGQYSAVHALEELDSLHSAFGDMGLLQEQAAVRLHRAELLRLLGNGSFKGELDELESLSIALQNSALLAREWLLLPELQRVAFETHPRIAGRTHSVLEVVTLGEEKLIFNSQPVHLPLRKGIELMAYFLERKAVSLRRLMLDVFPGEKPQTAKSYFHQFRNQIREHLKELTIEYDSEARMYHISTDVDIVWDVAEARANVDKGPIGVFLPNSTSPWARELREDLRVARAS